MNNVDINNMDYDALRKLDDELDKRREENDKKLDEYAQSKNYEELAKVNKECQQIIKLKEKIDKKLEGRFLEKLQVEMVKEKTKIEHCDLMLANDEYKDEEAIEFFTRRKEHANKILGLLTEEYDKIVKKQKYEKLQAKIDNLENKKSEEINKTNEIENYDYNDLYFKDEEIPLAVNDWKGYVSDVQKINKLKQEQKYLYSDQNDAPENNFVKESEQNIINPNENTNDIANVNIVPVENGLQTVKDAFADVDDKVEAVKEKNKSVVETKEEVKKEETNKSNIIDSLKNGIDKIKNNDSYMFEDEPKKRPLSIRATEWVKKNPKALIGAIAAISAVAVVLSAGAVLPALGVAAGDLAAGYVGYKATLGRK